MVCARGNLPAIALWTACVLAMQGIAAADEQPPLRDVIDARIRAAWEREGVTPSSMCDDAAFVRRVYLDLVGMIPSQADAQAFLDDPEPRKRVNLIDRLLDDPRFARHQAEVWDQVLFGRHPPGYQTDQRAGFLAWLRKQIEQNVPYNEWVRQLMQAEGNTVEHGAPMYLVQYRSAPEDAAVAISQTFLGVQLQCARCHDHPYEAWTQLDFYGLASFFARLQVVEAGKQENLTKYMIGEMNKGELLFTGPAAKQEPGKKGDPIKPQFLEGTVLEEPELPADFKEERHFPAGKEPAKPQFSRKDRLAEWISSTENPYLGRAAANRVWSQFLGRGLVQPVDNMSPSNVPSHPELLNELAKSLVEHRFDLKWYIRELVNTQTYQLASAGPVEEARPQWFQQGRWRPLSAEELVDSWRTATGYDAAFQASGKEQPKGRFQGVTGDYVLKFFGEPTDGVGNFQGGLQEHLYLNNGELPRIISTEKESLYDTLMRSDAPWEQRVERLFLSILSRRPDPKETETFVAYITAEKKPEERLREAIWTLLTCSEFRFNH